MRFIDKKFSKAAGTKLRDGVIAGLLLSAAAVIPSAMAGNDPIVSHRIGPVVASADGHWLVWQQQDIDSGNRASRQALASLWTLDLTTEGAKPASLISAVAHNARAPVFSGTDNWIYFISDMSGTEQLWRVDPVEGIPEQVSR